MVFLSLNRPAVGSAAENAHLGQQRHLARRNRAALGQEQRGTKERRGRPRVCDPNAVFQRFFYFASASPSSPMKQERCSHVRRPHPARAACVLLVYSPGVSPLSGFSGDCTGTDGPHGHLYGKDHRGLRAVPQAARGRARPDRKTSAFETGGDVLSSQFSPQIADVENGYINAEHCQNGSVLRVRNLPCGLSESMRPCVLFRDTRATSQQRKP